MDGHDHDISRYEWTFQIPRLAPPAGFNIYWMDYHKKQTFMFPRGWIRYNDKPYAVSYTYLLTKNMLLPNFVYILSCDLLKKFCRY